MLMSNILLAGIPTHPLLKLLRVRYPGELNLYVAESRPFELLVARAIESISGTVAATTVLTDNMMAALMASVPIHAVWSQYMKINGKQATAISGALMASLMARAFEIPCLLYPMPGLPDGVSGKFAGEDITVAGANYIIWEPDIVPLEFISEVIEHG